MKKLAVVLIIGLCGNVVHAQKLKVHEEGVKTVPVVKTVKPALVDATEILNKNEAKPQTKTHIETRKIVGVKKGNNVLKEVEK